jgi:hypothetical protein
MATPGQLVQAIAEALGVPVETVTNYDRVLSENGMRSKSGRGRGAARVTPTDAANLLIAILGSPIAGASVKESANTCRTYGSLPVLGHVCGTLSFASARVGLRMLDELPKKHTLRDGISALIQSAASGEHYRVPAKHFDIGCTTTLVGPQPWAEIYAAGDIEGAKSAKFARRVYTWGEKPLPIESDLRQERRITYRTIRRIGLLLSESKSTQ